MPEIISTPKALVQTTNGKRCYIYSGQITVPASETTILNIDNIGERDIKMNFELMCVDATDKATTTRIRINDVIVLAGYIQRNDTTLGYGHDEIRMILPANTSFQLTLEMSSSTAVWSVAGYGKYLSMD